MFLAISQRLEAFLYLGLEFITKALNVCLVQPAVELF